MKLVTARRFYPTMSTEMIWHRNKKNFVLDTENQPAVNNVAMYYKKKTAVDTILYNP